AWACELVQSEKLSAVIVPRMLLGEVPPLSPPEPEEPVQDSVAPVALSRRTTELEVSVMDPPGVTVQVVSTAAATPALAPVTRAAAAPVSRTCADRFRNLIDSSSVGVRGLFRARTPGQTPSSLRPHPRYTRGLIRGTCDNSPRLASRLPWFRMPWPAPHSGAASGNLCPVWPD